MNTDNAIAELFICVFFFTCCIIYLAWVFIRQNKRIETLESWVIQLDKAIDPEGTGDAYVDNLREEKRK